MEDLLRPLLLDLLLHLMLHLLHLLYLLLLLLLLLLLQLRTGLRRCHLTATRGGLHVRHAKHRARRHTAAPTPWLPQRQMYWLQIEALERTGEVVREIQHMTYLVIHRSYTRVPPLQLASRCLHLPHHHAPDASRHLQCPPPSRTISRTLAPLWRMPQCADHVHQTVGSGW